MTSCRHTRLALLPAKRDILRCLHCHLTIRTDELADGYCPECYEVQGRKHYDFEKLDTPEEKTARYRCEECGFIIESG